MEKMFGIDGVRGIAVSELTCEIAADIGRALAYILMRDGCEKAKIIIGKDTRISGDVIEAALVSGICSAGADACVLGVVPVGAVSVLIEKYHADAGIMITASHNSFEYNGIKIFDKDGYKISENEELEIDKLMNVDNKKFLKSGSELGHVFYEKNALWDYVRYVMKTVDVDFRGIKIAIDCANGSASLCAEKIFDGLGAKCVMLNDNPDGININKDCGCENTDLLCKTVLENRCSLGIAFDGDGDRCLAVDENGKLCDGDKILAVLSAFMKSRGKLNANTCVCTVMTNLGFYKYAKQAGIVVATTKVGDKNVLDEMLDGGYNLGGEQLGNIILFDYAKTGDGLITATQLIKVMMCTERNLSELAGCMESYPQVIVNAKIPPDKKSEWQNDSEVKEAVKRYSEKLGDDGRIIVRQSGTEPLVRIMIEGKRTGVVTEYALEIAKLIENIKY